MQSESIQTPFTFLNVVVTAWYYNFYSFYSYSRNYSDYFYLSKYFFKYFLEVQFLGTLPTSLITDDKISIFGCFAL